MKSGIPACKSIPILFVLIGCAGVTSAFVNEFDQPAMFVCSNGQYLSHIISYHENRRADRRWQYECTGSGASNGCSWSDYLNVFDEPLAFLCPSGSVITGMYSEHLNGPEDRRFKFECCSIPGKNPSNCYVTNWVNSFDGYMNFRVPDGQVLTGGFSYHSNHYEDRRWRFIVCSL